MPHIPPEVIEEIKQVANIVDIISEYLPLKKVGKNYVALCPFHQEDTPSFTVSEEKQIFHCFGCGTGGNVFTFLMKYKQCSFYEAVEEVAERYGISLSRFKFSPEEMAAYERRQKLYTVNQLAAEFFHHYLLHAPEAKVARDYLAKRGIGKDTIISYTLGFAPSKWDALVRHLQQKGMELSLGAEVGLLVEKERGGFYDRFRQRVIFPIFDQKGRVIAFGGRVLDDSLPKYINSPETPIYKKGYSLYGAHVAREWCQREQTVMLVEGYFDLLSLHAAGIKNVVASLGTALTQAQARILKNLAPRVIVMYDADAAGQKAAIRTLAVLLPLDLSVDILLLPEGDDPDSFVQREGKEAFLRYLHQAQPLLDWYLKQGEERTRSDLEARFTFLKEAMEIISLLKNPLKQEHYKDKICTLFGIERPTLDRLSQKQEPDNIFTEMTVLEEELPVFERRLVKFLLHCPEYLGHFSLEELLVEIKHPILRALLQKMFAFYTQHQRLETDMLIAELDEVSRGLVSAWLMEEMPEDPEEVAQGFLFLLQKRRLKRLSEQIKEAEEAGNWEKLTTLLRQKNELACAFKRC